MVAPVACAQFGIQASHFLCDGISDICKIIYDLAIRIIKSISNCFGIGQSAAVATTLDPSRLTLEGPLVAFYRGGYTDNGGTLDQMLSWDDARLESVHDYIQWLFPLR